MDTLCFQILFVLNKRLGSVSISLTDIPFHDEDTVVADRNIIDLEVSVVYGRPCHFSRVEAL